MYLEQLKDGKFLKECIEDFYKERNEENLNVLLSVLKDSTIYFYAMGILPSYAYNEDKKPYLSVYSSYKDVPKEISSKYEVKMMHFQDAMILCMDCKFEGIVINPDGNPFEINKDTFEDIMYTPSNMEDKEYSDPSSSYLKKGNEFYFNQNFEEAKKWYIKSSRLFNDQAFAYLGYIYTDVEKNQEKGFEYFEKAANKGNIHGLMKVADAYRYGDLKEMNPSQALMVYNELYYLIKYTGQMEEYPEVLLRMGESYFYGIGQEKDYGEAIFFFSLCTSYFEAKENEIFYYKDLKKKSSDLYHASMEANNNIFTLTKVQDVNFRKLLEKIFYLECKDVINKFNLNTEYDGCLCYGYVDEELGLSFRILCYATFNKSEQVFSKPLKEEIVLTKQNVMECGYLPMGYRMDEAPYIPMIEQIQEEFQPMDPSIYLIRYMADLDILRHPTNPDDFMIYIFNETESEIAWFHAVSYRDGILHGVLLSDTKSNFKVTRNSFIDVQLIVDQGQLLLICDMSNQELN